MLAKPFAICMAGLSARWLITVRWSNVGIMDTGLTGLILMLGTALGKRLGETRSMVPLQMPASLRWMTSGMGSATPALTVDPLV